jgi:hypothetical protein
MYVGRLKMRHLNSDDMMRIAGPAGIGGGGERLKTASGDG